MNVLFIETPYDEAFRKYKLELPDKTLRKDMDGEAVQLGVQTRFDMACIRKFLMNHSLTLVPVSFIRLSFIPLPLYLCFLEWYVEPYGIVDRIIISRCVANF